MPESVEDLLRAEREADRMSALVRLGIFVLLAAAVFYAVGQTGFHYGAMIDVGLYGLATVASLVLAWSGIYHRAIPYVFATFDVLLVVAHMRAIIAMMGGDGSLFTLPAAILVLILLIHASVRYQPWLVAYIAGLFVLAVFLGSALPMAPGGGHMGPPTDIPMRMPETAGVGMGPVIAFDVVPPMLVVFAAVILVMNGKRTRHLLVESTRQAARTARLSRFFSPNVAAQLADGEDRGAMSGRRQPIGVLFIDIVGFTALGESTSPEALGGFLSEFRARVTECVFAHGGTIDKFIGDAVLVVFGAPDMADDDAGRTVSCGVEILEVMTAWSAERERRAEAPVRVGIGGHYGEAFVGVLGSGRLLEYTVIGDAVNVAERLERLTREVDGSFVISRELMDKAAGMATVDDWADLPPQVLRGRSGVTSAAMLRSG